MKRAVLSAAIAALALSSIASAATTVVSPTSLNGWNFYSTNDSGTLNTGTATAGFANGPSTPPLGTGSAHLQTGAGAGDGSAQMRTGQFAGTRLDALTSLGYSTYVSSWNGQQAPYLTLWLDTNNDGDYDDRIHFEPAYTGAPTLNSWQTWNVLGGNVYNDNGPSGPGDQVITFAAYLLAHPDATLVNPTGGLGFRITSGFASPEDNFNTYVDNVTIGTAASTTTFDFENSAVTAPVPLPTGASAGLGLMALLGLRRRR